MRERAAHRWAAARPKAGCAVAQSLPPTRALMSGEAQRARSQAHRVYRNGPGPGGVKGGRIRNGAVKDQATLAARVSRVMTCRVAASMSAAAMSKCRPVAGDQELSDQWVLRGSRPGSQSWLRKYSAEPVAVNPIRLRGAAPVGSAAAALRCHQ